MLDPVFLTPVPGDDPCGPDLSWSTELMTLDQTLDTLVSERGAVEGEREGGTEATFGGVADAARALCARTKHLRVLAVHAEAVWRDRGLAAFAEAMDALVEVARTWPDPATGVHPRADPEDGDRSERAAPLARLLGRIPTLAATVGPGQSGAGQEQAQAAHRLAARLDAWEADLGPALGEALPSAREAHGAVLALVGATSEPGGESDGATGTAPRATALRMDAWEAIDRAAERMAEQNAHSPALPLLRLMSTWRDLDIVELSAAMKKAGVSLEQLFEAMRKYTGRG